MKWENLIPSTAIIENLINGMDGVCYNFKIAELKLKWEL